MPRYFFDIHDGDTCVDEHGMQLPNLDAAIDEAIRSLPNIAAHEIPVGDDRRHFTMVVRNSRNQPVYTAALSYVGIRLTPAPDRLCNPHELRDVAEIKAS
jgi:hypothetical protein